MDVSKLPPSGLPTGQPETPPSKERLVNEIAAVITQDLQEIVGSAPVSDRADIRPLDVPGGLQILLTEVRSALQIVGSGEALVASPALAATPAQVATPAQAAHQIVEWLLTSLPEDAGNAPLWSAALVRAESALQTGLQQAAGVVLNWHDVPKAVLDAVEQSAALVLKVLSDETPNPSWLRPEWMGLSPRLERFRRRRRAVRRRLTDPDLWQWGLDDPDEQTR